MPSKTRSKRPPVKRSDDEAVDTESVPETEDSDVFDFTPGKKTDGPTVRSDDDDLTDFLAGLN